MKTRNLFFAFLMCLSAYLTAQVTTVPEFVPYGYDGEVTVIFNPNEGNKGMVGATKCYAHTGVTLGTNTWQKVLGSWRSYPDKCQLTKNTDGNWELKITPNIKEFYGLTDAQLLQVRQFSFVFNDGPNGSKEGKTTEGGDIFYDLVEPGIVARLIHPSGDLFLKQSDALTIEGMSSQKVDVLSLSLNGKVIAKEYYTSTISTTYQFDEAGVYELTLIATGSYKNADGDRIHESKTDSYTLTVISAKTQARPADLQMGITYDAEDDAKVTLCTYAASKTEAAKAVYVIGDFNNWQVSEDYQMWQDGNYFWLEINGLEPQKEYAFQYEVIRADGVVKQISDLYSRKLLHPDDRYEPRKLDPSLKAYPSKGDGYVTVIETGKPQFEWSEATLNFKRPNKNNLVIYELWVYDYTEERSFQGLIDRLDYIQNLGVNAIELMPVCEFDGNYNWGYSPNHYFAVDKAYGTEEDFCRLIDECHKRGMAVIMDMVFNHATGLNPMNKLYPYGSDLSKNPWFNVNAPHSDNVYEDWNHDFEPAREMFTRALRYWIEEFHVDGYRMDLSHGFCGTNCNNRMNNLRHYYAEGVQAAGEDAYFILEHWGDKMASERPQLVTMGAMCWQNTNNAYSQLAMGYTSESSLTAANLDGYVSYCESHDEERNYYKAKTWGAGDLKTNETARLSRVPLTMAFNLLLNGPKMIWQYNELGYDYSINSTAGSSTISEDNRTSIKQRPEPLGWFDAGIRMEQYQKVAQVAHLRTHILPDVFEGNPTKASLASGWTRSIEWGEGDKRVVMVGNFSPTAEQTVTIPEGSWYDYLAGEGAELVEGGSLTLAAGELRILTAAHIDLPEVPASYGEQTGIEEAWMTGQDLYSVYPTVVTDRVFVSDKVDVRLFDLRGNQVLAEENVSSVRMNDLPAGLYLLHLQGTAGSQTVRLLKQ